MKAVDSKTNFLDMALLLKNEIAYVIVVPDGEGGSHPLGLLRFLLVDLGSLDLVVVFRMQVVLGRFPSQPLGQLRSEAVEGAEIEKGREHVAPGSALGPVAVVVHVLVGLPFDDLL